MTFVKSLFHGRKGTESKNDESVVVAPVHGLHETIEIGASRASSNGQREGSGVMAGSTDANDVAAGDSGVEVDARRVRSFAKYIRTREFWIALFLGQVLALCIVATNTFTTLLVEKKTNIPAFQTLFTYILLNLVYTSYTLYKYGLKKWGRVVMKDWWRYLALAFCDVQGNYFIVLAYRYTNILSAQLLNFWAIVVVVAVSVVLLRVRYHLTQYAGILLCCGGVGVLLASDYIDSDGATGSADVPDQLKGDLFAVLAASFYGLANVTEEVLVSRRPLYEVVGQLGFWAMLINGTQAAIFDRAALRRARWDGDVGGYLVGYTLILFTFYSLAPVLFRLTSAAFFNISLLTAGFWAVLVGIELFGLSVHWMYPIAFCLIVAGLFVYFLMGTVFAEARKPWLGVDQERGVDGLGTARRGLRRGHAI